MHGFNLDAIVAQENRQPEIYANKNYRNTT